MKWIKIGMPVLMILISLTFLIGSFAIPKATLGNPNGPSYFPIGLSVLMLVLSIVYLFNELKTLKAFHEGIKDLMDKKTLRLIGFTIILGVIYANIFERVGFFVSTLLFLGVLLFYLNGMKKWLINIVVSISFSFITWYGFSQLLGVSLP
ncbi:tripartite tricarboxylate transporter TctB family protein [Ureibacillus acetophenoni]|uniref:Putative tricarboxylic transport membrane protein n=1 Tax=Ureibacillus acetophenoni TaxID=614649 RepID=A0A285UHR3_9BACL|nr:tripartite tricarboxylate transporter TctB family protein [Ureibacillus acetophenoni]SOC41420.1 putative tricarboxylic transport membrane protein [Ureibacillus acetophenoni]